ncbi:hypothetical protein [Nocardioides daphniae]|uniref:Uncharacterized protein n=1 Tax=Nocardioides daphniae TaxID=402297 RepID=A0A4P7UCI6_9ACTN|nr:hypothetical protein [Nocardioides daphniae]QCC77504.1 hypothetical protein E2C04_10535 [Nocardioides daphniae]
MLQRRDGARHLVIGCIEFVGASAVALVHLRVRERRPEEIAQPFDDEQLFGVGPGEAAKDQLARGAVQDRHSRRRRPGVAVVLHEYPFTD